MSRLAADRPLRRKRIAHAARAGSAVLRARPRLGDRQRGAQLADDACASGGDRRLPLLGRADRRRAAGEVEGGTAVAAILARVRTRGGATARRRDRTVADGSFLRYEPPAIRGNGYVTRSLEAALWAFAKSTCFEDGALLAVNLGEDADTTGAVYGQLAGAFYGVDAIPERWRMKLAKLRCARELRNPAF